MSLLREGTACREYALRFPEFCYIKPLVSPTDARSVYDRLVLRNVRTVPLLNFTVDCKDLAPKSGMLMTVWFEPNEFTLAQTRKRVLQVMVRADPADFDRHIDDMLREVFRYPNTGV